MILADSSDDGGSARRSKPSWIELLKLPQTWGVIVARAFTDPVWYFIADWFPIYLVAKGISLKSGLIAIWIPFIAADLGNFFGGATSGYLIKRGWSLGAARKALVVFGGVGVTLLIPTILTVNLAALTLLFALATFCYAAFSTIANVLPSDLFASDSVASVSGLVERARARYDCCLQIDWLFNRCKSVAGYPLVRFDHDCGGPGAVLRDDSGAPACSE